MDLYFMSNVSGFSHYDLYSSNIIEAFRGAPYCFYVWMFSFIFEDILRNISHTDINTPV